VNGKAVNNLSDFFAALNDKSNKELWFEVIRGDAKMETMRYKR